LTSIARAKNLIAAGLFRCFLAPAPRQHEVQGFSEFVDGAIEIDPLSFHLDVGLVHPPGPVRRLLAAACILCDLPGIALHPSVQGGMIDPGPALGHDLLKVAV
jgi:hypothetical protein